MRLSNTTPNAKTTSIARSTGPMCGADQRMRWSVPMWSPPPESNRRPHPYHGTTRNRCADRRSRRSRPTAGPKLSVLLRQRYAFTSRQTLRCRAKPSSPSRSRPRYALCLGERRGDRNPAGSEPGGDPPKPPGAAPPGPSTARGVRNPTAVSTSGNRSGRLPVSRPDAIARRLPCLE